MPNGLQTRWLTDIGLALGLLVALIVIAAAEPRSRGEASPPPLEVASAEPVNNSPEKPNLVPAKPDQSTPSKKDSNSKQEPLPVKPEERIAIKPKENEVKFLGVKSQGQRFCIIADNSGSMSGPKIIDLRTQLLKTLKDFDKGGEYYIYCFNSVSEPMPHSSWLTNAAPEAGKIRTWVEDINPRGGTDPTTTFRAAFKLSPPPDVIFFMTDGIIPPTVPALVERLNTGTPRVVVNTIMFADSRFVDMLAKKVPMLPKGAFPKGAFPGGLPPGLAAMEERAEVFLKQIAKDSGGTFTRYTTKE